MRGGICVSALRGVSVGVNTFTPVTELPPFESSLPEARSAATAVPAGSAGSPTVRAGRGVEEHVIAALEESFLEYLAHAQPGLELQQMLLSFPPHCLTASVQLEWLRAHARCSSWWSAQEAPALVAFAGPSPQLQSFEVRGQQVVVEDVAREEVAVVLRWTSNFAQGRIDDARMLVGALPETLQALRTGSISPAHVRVITESASKLALTAPIGTAQFAEACAQLERRVLPVAALQGLSRTRSAANRAVTRIDPDGRIERRTAAYRGRGVWLRDDSDGVSTIISRMASEHAHAAMAAIEALACTDDFGDTSLGIGERRSLAMLRLMLDSTDSTNAGTSTSTAPGAATATGIPVESGASSAHPSSRQPDLVGERRRARTQLPTIRAHVDVIVDLPTLLGLQDNDAEIVGGGSITAESVRQLVVADTSSTMRRLITDPTTGHLLDIGRRRYVIPTALREFIAIRDQRCRFPGCSARASSGEVDHALPWDAGGNSDRANLGSLCKRHHQVKTHGGWTIQASVDSGACDWISPSGQTYAHAAVPLDSSLADGVLTGPVGAADYSGVSAEPGVPFPDRDVGQTRNLIDHHT